MNRVAFYTLGCKVNQYETDAMSELFVKRGYALVDFQEPADIYIINTCTVTNMADRKSRQMIRRARKRNPQAIIAAVGCYVQADPEACAKDPMIDLTVGNNHKTQIVDLVENYMSQHRKMDQMSDMTHCETYEDMMIHSVTGHTRAYIKIQDGCNQFCSYCIIPFARGRVRSRQPEDILEEVGGLAQGGYKEIVLTGIHMSSYGKDFEQPETALIRLVEALGKIPGIERIRFGSLEPGIIDEDFVRRLKAVPSFCPHFHLSLQSGCAETLKRMNRRYTPEEYMDKCRIIRKYFDRPAFTTDVIVGFPGETDEEFEETEKFLKEVAFAQLHVFKYSKRQGTKAAAMKEQIPDSIKEERSRRLLALSERLQADYRRLCQDKRLEILLEESAETADGTYWTGHSREYLKCGIRLEGDWTNRLVYGQISQKTYEDFVICERMD